MLVLSRKQGEGIVVGDEIRVVVLEVRGGRVRLGIEAPNYVPVRREELLRRSGIRHERVMSLAHAE